MNKYILIDLEDTLTIHQDKERVKNTKIEWLKYNHVQNPWEILSNPAFKTRATRLPLLGIDMHEYKKWYQNFNEVEYTFLKNKYQSGQVEITMDASDFVQNSPLPLILVSNSSPLWVDYILNEYQLTSYFKYIFRRTYEFDDIQKPDKRVKNIIERAINDTISPDSIVIGDSKTDYQFAHNCRLKFIGMYNQFENELCFNDFVQVFDYLKR